MEYPIKCTICRQWKTVIVDEKEFADWNNGMLIQKAMPNLNADDRELLMSQTCGKCYDAMFSEEEEDICDETENDLS